MTEDLEARLRRLRASERTSTQLIDLGCDLADAGRQRDAEWCFRRAADLGDAGRLRSTSATPSPRRSGGRRRSPPTSWRWPAASPTPGATSAGCSRTSATSPGRMRAYRGAADAGDLEGGLQLAFLLRSRASASRPSRWPRSWPRPGDDEAAAVLACWRWCATRDPALEPDLRAGADLFPRGPRRPRRPAARDRPPAEARFVLERGAKRGDVESPGCRWATSTPRRWRDDEAAEEAYRSGIAAGDVYCHHNLGVLLAERGDFDGAVEQFRLGAAAGDELAASALREFDRG